MRICVFLAIKICWTPRQETHFRPRRVPFPCSSWPSCPLRPSLFTTWSAPSSRSSSRGSLRTLPRTTPKRRSLDSRTEEGWSWFYIRKDWGKHDSRYLGLVLVCPYEIQGEENGCLCMLKWTGFHQTWVANVNFSKVTDLSLKIKKPD